MLCKHLPKETEQRQARLILPHMSLGAILLLFSWSKSPNPSKYRSTEKKSDLHICDFLWSFHFWGMCCLTVSFLICLRSPWDFCSLNGAKSLQRSHVGWIFGECWHVQIFRSTWFLPDSDSSYMRWLLRVQRQRRHARIVCATGQSSHWSSAMAIFCLQILCVTACIPQKFCPVFCSKCKGHTMWFCHCLMHRSILHRLRIQVFSKLTLASCTRWSQSLSSPKFRSGRVIQALGKVL